MNVFNERVSHRRYGAGTVVSQTETMIEVQFNDEYGKKKFLYPSAFESFLSFVNSERQEMMDEELKQIRKTREEEQKRREHENAMRQEEVRKAEKKNGAEKNCRSGRGRPAREAQIEKERFEEEYEEYTDEE